jgi:hypothetical protein
MAAAVTKCPHVIPSDKSQACAVCNDRGDAAMKLREYVATVVYMARQEKDPAKCIADPVLKSFQTKGLQLAASMEESGAFNGKIQHQLVKFSKAVVASSSDQKINKPLTKMGVVPAVSNNNDTSTMMLAELIRVFDDILALRAK